MAITQKEYNVHFQRTRWLNIKIEVLNDKDRAIDRVEGLAIDGSINLDAKSTHRRTGNLTMTINKGGKLIPSENSYIWFDKKIKVLIGLKNFNGEIIWFNQGVFLIKNAEVSYSNSEKTLTVSLIDSMAYLDGTFSGQLANMVEIVAEGATVTQAIRSVVSQLGRVSIEDVAVNGASATVPYEITKNPSGTVYDLIKELVDLYKGYEFFFNENGYFITKKIDDGKEDPLIWDFSQNKRKLIIDYTSQINFNNVKNSIYVWGKKKSDGTQVRFSYKNKYERETIADRDAITNQETGDICHVRESDTSYMWDGTLTTPTWVILNFTVIGKFNIENIGERKHVYNDDKIFNEDQASLRAEYELKQKSNLGETVDFSTIPIYLLKPNHKIRLENENANVKGEYLIESISVPLSVDGTMSVRARKLYY